MQEDWRRGGTRTYQWCKGLQDEAASMLLKPDGSLTCDPREVDDLLHEAWMPILQEHANKGAPAWATFENEFGDCIASASPMTCRDLTGACLRKTLRRMANKSAPGADGWRVSELKALPDCILDRLATLFNQIELAGSWPEALKLGLVSLISKGDGTAPDKLRPITVTSAVYRLRAATRVAEVLVWQESWINNELRGFRHASGADDIWFEQALLIEKS